MSRVFLIRCVLAATTVTYGHGYRPPAERVIDRKFKGIQWIKGYIQNL